MVRSLLQQCRVLPVITAHDVETTVQLARTLQQAGVPAVEITLRTEAALETIRAIKAEVPDVRVAAGTIISPEDLRRAVTAGADFCVSPGLTETLLRTASEDGTVLVPGVATASDIMLGLEYGHHCFKLFPAVAAGGINLLKSLAGPFPDLVFCPTGGLNKENFRDFLALPNVICCGGSWMVADALVNAGNWDEIRAGAVAALAHE